MITIRKAADRGHSDRGWLESHHSFSFADYHDPVHMGVGNLRVINEDRLAAGGGFGTHRHQDMEIVSYVLEGELAHKDSMGNGTGAGTHDGVIRPGDVQRMSAGTGVMHSEFNHSADQKTHFLQIWIQPKLRGIAPSYEQKHFDGAERRGRLRTIVAPGGADGAVSINAEATIRAGLFDGAESTTDTLDPKRVAYVHVARGEIEVNGRRLTAGDGATLNGEVLLELNQGRDAEVLVFDLARQ
jgi:redox-sensitive bicupin YhaK (pirin superfamily)